MQYWACGGGGVVKGVHMCGRREGGREGGRVYQGLDHGGSLDAEVLDGLEDVNEALQTHPLHEDVQRDEHAAAANAIAGGRGQCVGVWQEGGVSVGVR